MRQTFALLASLVSSSDSRSLQVAASPCCTMALPVAISVNLPCVSGPLSRPLPRCIYPFLPSEQWPSPREQWVGVWHLPQQPFPLRLFSRLQSFTNVQTHRIARLTDSSYPRIFPCRAAEAFTSAHITVGYLPRAADMLTVQIRAIDGKRTSTPPI
jgi:hypothetical protein